MYSRIDLCIEKRKQNLRGNVHVEEEGYQAEKLVLLTFRDTTDVS